ncbi:MAG: tyrosine-type recombinase/integrase [Neisseria sp.]|nr:tyrosine-type recombinase/integrase [Neisseria sp.]
MDIQDFSVYADDFLTALAREGKSAHTLAAYRRDLAQLFSLLPEDGGLNAAPLRAAFKKLSQQNLSERSLARKLSVWKQYSDFLVRHGKLPSNPIAALKAPKIPQHLPKAVKAETLNFALDHTETESATDVRDLAIFELLYGSGLRVSEVWALNVDDVLTDEGWVSVTGKGNKQRQVPLSEKSTDALNAYLAQRQAAAGETALFTGRNGKRLSVRQIQNRLREWGEKNQLPEHLHPHKLRHSYASHLLQSAGDIRAVQELLGHSSLSTTQIYTKLDFDHLAAVYDAAHPRAKRKKEGD